MQQRRLLHTLCAATLLIGGGAAYGQNLLANPSFDDLDNDGVFGDGWGAFGAADFNEFFGADNPHASLFADTIGNSGGVFQAGIPAAPGDTFMFDVLNTRIEASFDGMLTYGVEFYADDDATKLGVSTATVAPGVTGDGLSFAILGTAPAQTAFVRPIVQFDGVQTTGGTERNVFVFDARLIAYENGQNLLRNRQLEDFNEDDAVGDFWGAFGAASFNAFFGANGHGSLFGDFFENIGGIFQVGLPGVDGVTYQFDLLDVRIEANWDADLYAGFEYYAADDATKLGESLTLLDTAARLANGSTDGNTFSVIGTAVPGTAIVRPIVRFDNVNPVYFFQSQANAFVFNTFMGLAPLNGDERIKNPGFDDIDGDGGLGDVWGLFGNAEVNEFFGAGNPHASFFADLIGNSGGFFQQSILGEPSAAYRFELVDVRIEPNFDADFFFGLEFYEGDNATKLGETIVPINTAVSGDGLSFVMTATAPAGTIYVRPVFLFDNVGSDGGSDRNAFVFATSLKRLSGVTGDANGDATLDGADAFELYDCLNGPGVVSAPQDSFTPSQCAEFFDSDDDGDVDLADAADYALLF